MKRYKYVPVDPRTGGNADTLFFLLVAKKSPRNSRAILKNLKLETLMGLKKYRAKNFSL
jgi:hypothetical protein